VSVARNTGITHAKGQYLCYLDSDDLWHKDKLAEMHEFIQQYPSLDIYFHDFRKHDVKLPRPYELSNTDMFSYILTMFSKESKSIWLAKDDDAFYLTMKGYPFYPSVVTLKREVHDQYRWDPGVLKSEDFNLMLKLSFQYKFGYLNKDLATIRVHDSNKSADSLTKDRIVLRTMQLVSNLYCSPKMKIEADKYITSKFFYSGLSQIKSGNYRQGFSWLFTALTDFNFYYSRLQKIFK
jgi:glycosyltransferase involved in cell wall biosynthesis